MGNSTKQNTLSPTLCNITAVTLGFRMYYDFQRVANYALQVKKLK